jgi:hypothetical protein
MVGVFQASQLASSTLGFVACTLFSGSDSVTIRRRRGTPRRGNIVWTRSAQPILCLNELRMAAGNLPPYCAASTPLIVLIRVFCRSCSSLFCFSCSRGIGERGAPAVLRCSCQLLSSPRKGSILAAPAAERHFGRFERIE